MNSCWHNTDQVWVFSRLTYFYMSYYKIMTWIFWINLYRHNTDQVSFVPLSSAFVGVMPRENLPEGDLYCFSNTFRMLVYMNSIAMTFLYFYKNWLTTMCFFKTICPRRQHFLAKRSETWLHTSLMFVSFERTSLVESLSFTVQI